MMGGAWVWLVVMALLGHHLSVRDKRVPEYPFWGPSQVLPAMFVFALIAAVIIHLASVYGFPGTDIQPNADIFRYAIPTVVVFGLMIGSTDVVVRRHGGHVVVAWLVALLISLAIASALKSGVLVPYRHVPYIVEASAVLVGIGTMHLIALWKPRGHFEQEHPDRKVRRRRRTIAYLPFVAAVLIAIMALAATAYPPKAVMGNFQEGTTGSEVGATIWLRGGLPRPGAAPGDLSSGCVVTDHRLSSISFGIGGLMATWDKGGPVLHGGRDDATRAALEAMETPHGTRPVTAVVLSDDLRTGAALSQVDTPRPVEGEAWDKFFGPPFIRIYDDGDLRVFYVVRPLNTTGEL